jgi:hypothetical protein
LKPKCIPNIDGGGLWDFVGRTFAHQWWKVMKLYVYRWDFCDVERPIITL